MKKEEDHDDQGIVGEDGLTTVLFIAGSGQLVVIGPVLYDHAEGPDTWVGRETDADELGVENSHSILK